MLDLVMPPVIPFEAKVRGCDLTIDLGAVAALERGLRAVNPKDEMPFKVFAFLRTGSMFVVAEAKDEAGARQEYLRIRDLWLKATGAGASEQAAT